mmetsp:Transcript_7064/g.10126  ORF Transcript_7064/g.10126 Transcript_7064/m.10126 type:complete len:184 (+) Transcript_7064:465-1016(+)
MTENQDNASTGGENPRGDGENRQGQTQFNSKPKTKKKGSNNGDSGFDGLCKDMGGHVFQFHSEQKSNQFDKTMQALKIYASKVYKNDMTNLTPFFESLKMPVLVEPTAPTRAKKVVTKNGDGTETEEFKLTKVEKLRYQEKLKRFFNQEELLKAVEVGLFTVVIGQSSKLIKMNWKVGRSLMK